MKRTVPRLADGRQIIYFDEQDTAVRQLVDTRDLPRAATQSEVRYDPLLDEWVVLASHRQECTHLPPVEQCPLCPSTGERLSEIPSADYDVVIFENRFPSLGRPSDPVAPVTAPLPPDLEDGPAARRPGLGRCEVVCFTSDHGSSFAALSRDRARTVVEAWVDRTPELAELPGVEYVFVVREPRSGDRGDAAPSARPDLPLPVRATARAAHAGVGAPPSAPHIEQPHRLREVCA